MLKRDCSTEEIDNKTAVLTNEFISRSTFKEIDEIIYETKFLAINDLPFVLLKLHDIKKEKKRLVIIGDLSDLSQSATIGLLAHLFALLYMDYDKNPAPRGENWLKMDLHSDEIAREWGFRKEIDELRRIRPQKIPASLNYNDAILEHSVMDYSFREDVNSSLLVNSSSNFQKKSRILFTSRFSIVCNIEKLKKEQIANLIVVTNNYYKNKAELKNLFDNL